MKFSCLSCSLLPILVSSSLFAFPFRTDLNSPTIVTEHFPPFQIKGEKLEGVSIDIVNRINEKLGLDVEINELPWSRALYMAQSKPNVLIFTMGKSPRRMPHFHWVGELPIADSMTVWTHKSFSANGACNWKDLKELNTAIPRNDSFVSLLFEHGFVIDENLVITNTFGQMIEMLVKGRIDFAIAGSVSFTYQAQFLGYNVDDFVPCLPRGVTPYPLSYAFSKSSDPELVEAYRNAFQQMENDKELDVILQKWFK